MSFVSDSIRLIHQTELGTYSEFRDILEHALFQSMIHHRHHADISCLQHTLEVAVLTFNKSRHLKLDAISATRGALLHDFYLYDWHTDSPGLHGFRHPAIALANAQHEFSLNPIEENIIARHMWPLTPIPPKYAESMLVCLTDKIVSAKDYIQEIKRFNRFNRVKSCGCTAANE